MALRPMPFLVDHWLSSTGVRCLSLEMRGAFIELICYCWASGDASLPDDDFQLGKISGLGKRWATSGRTCLGRFFCPHPTKPGWLTSKRVYSLWIGDEHPDPENKPRKKATPVAIDAEMDLMIQQFINEWNATPGVLIVKRITPRRQQLLAKRLRDPGWEWRKALEKFPLPCFKEGDWVPNIEFIVRPESVVKIIEGAYDWQKSANNHNDPTGNIGVSKDLCKSLFGSDEDVAGRIEGSTGADCRLDGSLSRQILAPRNGVVPVGGQ